jgi:hypothetical protein
MRTSSLACDEREADICTGLPTVVVERFWRVRNPVEGMQVYCAAAEGIKDKGSSEQWVVVLLLPLAMKEIGRQQTQARDTLMASGVMLRPRNMM